MLSKLFVTGGVPFPAAPILPWVYVTLRRTEAHGDDTVPGHLGARVHGRTAVPARSCPKILYQSVIKSKFGGDKFLTVHIRRRIFWV